MWRVCKAANRAWPVLEPEDEVIDYLIMEAVAMKVTKEDEGEQKKKKAQDFKKDQSGLDNLRKVAGG